MASRNRAKHVVLLVVAGLAMFALGIMTGKWLSATLGDTTPVQVEAPAGSL